MPSKLEKNILRGDEGMWPFDAVPIDRVKKLHGVTLSEDWLTTVQRSTVRMNNGGSASFVSPEGLIATNHHVAASVLYELSSEKKDYLRDGFYAPHRDKELKAPQLEVNVLWEIEDVTLRVERDLRGVRNEKKRAEKKRALFAMLEKESLEKTGLRSDVVTLYNGGKYHLYRYKKYTDVRLVFAPESAIASYGGDVDNYEYPRYSLDVTFFRVYENGVPLATPDYFSWSSSRPRVGEVLFVAGHPGSTSRLTTYNRLRYLRDIGMPKVMDYVRRKEILLQQFSTRSPENARRSKDDLHGIQNVRKRYEGQLVALQNPTFFSTLYKREKTVRDAVTKNRTLRRQIGNPWDAIDRATQYFHSKRDEYHLFEGGRAFATEYFFIARTIVRLIDEDAKPNSKRLREFGDAKRSSLLDSLYSPAPLYKDLEAHKCADGLRLLVETLGADDPFVVSLLDGKSIEERARVWVESSKLHDPGVRKKLIDGGAVAIQKSNDPFIIVARAVDARSRRIRKDIEMNVDEVLEKSYGAIARAFFSLYGNAAYPDATFTLRLAYGSLVEYSARTVPEQKYTTIKGIVQHGAKHNFSGNWELPERWKENLTTIRRDSSAFNFITTHDTHGGNSGSPVFNERREIVGLLFDGLTHTQGDTFAYMADVPEHTISVHTQGILSVLTKIYKANRLVKELRGK